MQDLVMCGSTPDALSHTLPSTPSSTLRTIWTSRPTSTFSCNGNDREGLEKTTRIVTENEKRMREPIVVEFVDAEGTMKKEKAVIKRLTEGRLRLRKDVEFVGKPGQHWVLQWKLEAAGWEKMLKFVDDPIAT
jgi:hypothetical protein